MQNVDDGGGMNHPESWMKCELTLLGEADE